MEIQLSIGRLQSAYGKNESRFCNNKVATMQSKRLLGVSPTLHFAQDESTDSANPPASSIDSYAFSKVRILPSSSAR